MKQITHILKKDLRRFWWEIAISLILLAIYTYLAQGEWALPENPGNSTWQYNGPGLLLFVVMMVWIVILARVMHEESPAGDRQFWITRPYEWHKLLTAKVLFILVVINLPLLIAQMILLWLADFSPLHYLPGLLYMHLLVLPYVLPILALTVVTSGFGQMSRAAVILLFFLICLWTLNFMSTSASLWNSLPSQWDWLQRSLLIGIPVIVVVRQYAFRKTAQSRQLLMAGALAVAVLTAAMPYQRMFEAKYALPSAAEKPLFRIRLNPTAYLNGQSPNGKVQIHFAPNFSELMPGYLAHINAVLATVVAPDGARWNSGWEPANMTISREMFETKNSGENVSYGLGAYALMDRTFFNRVKDSPVKIQIDIAASIFRDQEDGTLITHTQEQFEIPGGGLCITEKPLANLPWSELWCRSPLHRPEMLGTTTQLVPNCLPGKNDSQKEFQQTGWVNSYMNLPLEFSINPVNPFTPNLTAMHTDTQTNQSYTIGWCAGTPLKFRQVEKIREVRVQQVFENLHLSAIDGPR